MNLSAITISFPLIVQRGKLVLILVIWGTTGRANLVINSGSHRFCKEKFVGNEAKDKSKNGGLQENKARQIF